MIMRCLSERRTIPDKQRKIYLARLGFEPATFGLLVRCGLLNQRSWVRIPAGPSRFFSACPVWFVARRGTSLLYWCVAHLIQTVHQRFCAIFPLVSTSYGSHKLPPYNARCLVFQLFSTVSMVTVHLASLWAATAACWLLFHHLCLPLCVGCDSDGRCWFSSTFTAFRWFCEKRTQLCLFSTQCFHFLGWQFTVCQWKLTCISCFIRTLLYSVLQNSNTIWLHAA